MRCVAVPCRAVQCRVAPHVDAFTPDALPYALHYVTILRGAVRWRAPSHVDTQHSTVPRRMVFLLQRKHCIRSETTFTKLKYYVQYPYNDTARYMRRHYKDIVRFRSNASQSSDRKCAIQ